MMFILNVNAYYITFSACYCCYCCLVLTHRRTVPLKAEGEKIVGEKLFFRGRVLLWFSTKSLPMLGKMWWDQR